MFFSKGKEDYSLFNPAPAIRVAPSAARTVTTLTGVFFGTASAAGHVEDGVAGIAAAVTGAFTVVSCAIVSVAGVVTNAAVAVTGVPAGILFDTDTALPA